MTTDRDLVFAGMRLASKKTAYDYPKIYEFEFFVSVDEVEEDLSKVTDISKIPKDSSKFADTAFEFLFDEGNSIECALQFYPYPIKSDSGEDELKFVASGTKDELEDAYYSLFKNFTRTPFDNAHLKVKTTDPEWQRMHLTEKLFNSNI